MRKMIVSMLAVILFSAPAMAAELPSTVASQVGTPLEEVGSGTYRKLGMSIYKASLFAPSAHYDASQPYALQLHYLTDLSKDTVVDAVMTDIRAQAKADAGTMDQWEAQLNKTLPAVKEGDEITGISIPGKPAKLYLNGKQIASIADKRFSQSFFNIWLGDVADNRLRSQLLAKN